MLGIAPQIFSIRWGWSVQRTSATTGGDSACNPANFGGGGGRGGFFPYGVYLTTWFVDKNEHGYGVFSYFLGGFLAGWGAGGGGGGDGKPYCLEGFTKAVFHPAASELGMDA